jgi:hypothetical protein
MTWHQGRATDWRVAQVARERTHHTVGGSAAYQARYRDVLEFRDPGLAPAIADDGATHIDISGRPAYPRRFLRTFGFYEGRAAVSAADGWSHILPDGTQLYDAGHEWCGNYQGGRCTVREHGGRYLHLRPDGQPAYDARWRYAGDHRDGRAVVQRDDGLHSHIDLEGRLVHDRWFVDLDVFHKGFARARDESGWTHVDRRGAPAYARRFATVEPFYNGQARVERADGGLEVIDERGQTVLELRGGRRSEFAALSSDLVGFWRTDAIAGAIEVGVIEALPGTTDDVAGRLGLNPGRLGALLRGLGELSLVEWNGEVWALTERGALLRCDHPWTLADAAREYAGPLRRSWARLAGALRDPAWRPPDGFGEVAADPARVGPHHRMLRSYARHDYPLVPDALGLRGDERVLDIGGGVGVLAGLLLDRHPGLDIVVLDRPEVVAQVTPRAGLRAVARDLFDAWDVEADVAVLARVVHDWPDDAAIRVLRNARRALPSHGRVFVIEMLVADDGTFGGLCDLHLLLATGGRERTVGEYAVLLAEAGFELADVRAIGALPAVLVAVAR